MCSITGYINIKQDLPTSEQTQRQKGSLQWTLCDTFHTEDTLQQAFVSDVVTNLDFAKAEPKKIIMNKN